MIEFNIGLICKALISFINGTWVLQKRNDRGICTRSNIWRASMQGITISNIKFFLHNNEVFHFIEKILTNFVPFHWFWPLRFSDIFSGYRKGALETNELTSGGREAVSVTMTHSLERFEKKREKTKVWGQKYLKSNFYEKITKVFTFLKRLLSKNLP